MPIRINLLAEAQAIEDLRRRDPVKRAIFAGLCLIILIMAWSSSLQLKSMMARAEVNRLELQLAGRTNEFQQVLDNQSKLEDANRKLQALNQLTSSRLLYGTLLNALQQTTIDDVQLMRFRAEQIYALSEATKAKTNADNRIIPGRPAAMTERITLTLDAKDSGVNPGDQVNKFKQTIFDCPYFQATLGKTNEPRLTSLSPPQATGGKPFVLFTLECKFPEKTR
jgi:hypothetical protein